MSYIYDDQVKEKLGLPTYNALMNAVETAVINQNVMRDFAKALGPRIGGGHIHRMDARGRCDKRELKEILSDWYNRGGLLRMSSEEAWAKLDAIFIDLNVTIEPHNPQPQSSAFLSSNSEFSEFQPSHKFSSSLPAFSSAMARPVPDPTSTITQPNTNTSQPVSTHAAPQVTNTPTVTNTSSQPAQSPRQQGSKRRRAFLVANTYEGIDESILKTLHGTERSIEIVSEVLAKQGFQSTTLLDQPFEKMLAEMKGWKKEALKDENPEALLFYFCGHGGKHSVDFTK